MMILKKRFVDRIGNWRIRNLINETIEKRNKPSRDMVPYQIILWIIENEKSYDETFSTSLPSIIQEVWTKWVEKLWFNSVKNVDNDLEKMLLDTFSLRKEIIEDENKLLLTGSPVQLFQTHKMYKTISLLSSRKNVPTRDKFTKLE